MRRAAFAVVALALAMLTAGVAAGCGGEEEATPTPDTITGTVTTDTETTDTETTDTETTETETTDTETTGETTTDTGTTGEGDPAAGKEIFVGVGGCGSCHTLADAGTNGTTGPDLDQVLKGKSAAFIKQSIEQPNAVIAKGYTPGIMPQTYAQSLKPAQLAALVKYLQEVTK
jgi:mono/diheme cytochrome c family protein